MLNVLIARLRDDRRIRRRMARVERLLRARDTMALSPERREARKRMLDYLRAYYRRGIFPRNVENPGRHQPVFIDGEGRVCAVAYLMLASGQDQLARRIARDANAAYIRQMHFSELD